MIYHKDIFMPAQVLRLCPCGVIQLKYSNHAILASCSDRYGNLPILSSLNTDDADIIEVEFAGHKIHKILYRIGFGELDICLAVMYDGTVKTVWANHSSDHHSTLDHSKYQRF